MVDYFQVDTVSRVQAVLVSEDPMNQIIRIREITNEPDCPGRVKNFQEFPDSPVRNGAKIYQEIKGRIFEIKVLRG
jgi:hypothetical protein